MNRLYKVNYKTSSERGITLNTTKGNFLLGAGLDPDIYVDEFREFVSIEKILKLPYKLGCVSNKYNKCNLYINNRVCNRVLEGIQEDKSRNLVALIFPDVFIIMQKEIYDFLEIDKSVIGKTFEEAFTDVINQETMNLELISTKSNKLQINISKIDESKYEESELDDVFSMFDRKPKTPEEALQEIVIDDKIEEEIFKEPVKEQKKPGRPKKNKVNRRPGK